MFGKSFLPKETKNLGQSLIIALWCSGIRCSYLEGQTLKRRTKNSIHLTWISSNGRSSKFVEINQKLEMSIVHASMSPNHRWFCSEVSWEVSELMSLTNFYSKRTDGSKLTCLLPAPSQAPEVAMLLWFINPLCGYLAVKMMIIVSLTIYGA